MFDLAWPWVFVLLPLPWLVHRFSPPVSSGQALRLPQPSLKLSQRDNVTKTDIWLPILAWLCLLLAAARPQWLGPPQVQRHNGRALMLAIDLSGSMRIPDMTVAGQSVSRFTAVKMIAHDFISRRDGDELGLILFGTRAFLVTPLTYDLHAVSAQLRDVTVGLAGPQTAIGDAIAVAVKRLSGLSSSARVLVLLTDGVNDSGSMSPLQAAHAAKVARVRIYTIGIGATGMPRAGLLGGQFMQPSSDLDVQTLKQIAQMTGGQFYRASDGQQLAAAYHAIDALEPVLETGPRLRLHHELFRWPLLAAVLCLALAWWSKCLRRRV